MFFLKRGFIVGSKCSIICRYVIFKLERVIIVSAVFEGFSRNSSELENADKTEKSALKSHSHHGHRERMRARFEKNGFHGFAEHEILEVLLYNANARGDTNPLAHDIIEHFGSLRAAFDAPLEELIKVKGVGAVAAFLIHMIPELSRIYAESSYLPDGIVEIDDAAKLLAAKFFGKREEHVAMLCLDNRRRPKFCDVIYKGSVNTVDVNMRIIMEKILAHEAVAVVLAHNHPFGFAIPSEADIMTTRVVKDYLAAINVTLLDHLIMVEGDYVSMFQSGMLDIGYGNNFYDSEGLELE